MKKLFLSVCVSMLLTACGGDVEKQATELLNAAHTSFEQGDFNQAKLQLDSIKTLYPKAFETRKAANRFLLEVELKEQEKGLVYLDSTQRAIQLKIDSIKANYSFEKDAEYQQIGNYFWPTQTVEKNLHRSFLRFQVNEKGEMTMTSIYCGGRNIHHYGVKVTAPDGSFAETPASNDSYETTDLGEKIEKADFKKGNDGNVIDFLYINKEKSLKVTLVGERNFPLSLPKGDRQALNAIYNLHQLLTAAETVKKNIKEANLKSEFLKRKMAQNKDKEVDQ